MQNLSNEKTKQMMKLLQNLTEIKKGDTYALFLRHADRDKIPEGSFGNDIELNAKGFKNAFAYGKYLQQFQLGSVFSSPIKRCIQTGEEIIAGAESTTIVQASSILGNPGAFIADEKQAGEVYQSIGNKSFYSQLIQRDHLPGTRTLEEGAELINDFINNQVISGRINIFISHDMITALYAWQQFGVLYTLPDNWIDYLKGLIIKLDK